MIHKQNNIKYGDEIVISNTYKLSAGFYHITSLQLIIWSPEYITSESNSIILAYSWKQTPPKQYTTFLTIFILVGSEFMLYTARPPSISSVKSVLLIFYNYFVILNFLSPAIKFFHIPLANFFIYLLEALQTIVPFIFFYFNYTYLLFLTASGYASQNYLSSSMLSSNIKQISMSLSLSSELVPYFNKINISLLSSFEIILLLYIQSSASQNQFSLLFLASPIISPALFRCHQTFLNFQLFSVYSSVDKPIILELNSFESQPSFISEMRKFFLFNHISSWRESSTFYLFFVTLLPFLLILYIFQSRLAQVMPCESIGKQSVYLLKIQKMAQFTLLELEASLFQFAKEFDTLVYLDFSFYTNALDCSLEGLQIKMGRQFMAVRKFHIYNSVGKMHIE